VRGGFAFVGGRLNRAAQLGIGEITQRENRPDYSAQFPESGFGGEIQGSTTVRYTRSRAYRKNDNARVEQKNWTHVRQLVGYARLEDPRVAELLNELYAKEWGWFRNFFCPVMKQVEGSRKRRVYDTPATPFERLKACAVASEQQIAALENLYRTLDPFALKEAIETKLRAVLRYQIRTPLFKAA
jgi:hypothetical protein